MLVITVIFFGVFSSLAYPMQEAKAGPLVGGLVPAGITAGAGAYLAGGLMLSGLVGVAGYHEYETSIRENSWGVWQQGTQLSKDSMNAMIEAANGTGVALQQVDAGVNEWVETNLGKLSQLAYSATAGEPISSENMVYFPYTYASTTIHIRGGANTAESGKTFLINGTNAISYQLLLYSSGNIDIKIYERAADGSVTNTATRINEGTYGMSKSDLENMMKQAQSLADGAAVLASVGISFMVIDSTMANDFIGIDQKVREAWTGMRDAGLVLPVDGITAHVGDIPVRANATGDAYTDDAGTVYNPADVDFAFPVPRIRTQDVPEAGVYTDTPALTGNPTIDEAITSNPAIPKTTTNIHTGTTIANPDIATGNPPITTDPPITAVPPFDAPGTTGLDFTPLMMTGEAMTNKFPFSIPFDFVRQIRVFDVEPVAPSFDIDIPEFIKLGGFVIPFKMKLSFEMFDPIANIIRWGMIIIWDISLIFAIRKLLPE